MELVSDSERVLFRPGGVNQRFCLCGVPKYASAQYLDFLAGTKNPSFLNRKLVGFHPESGWRRINVRVDKEEQDITVPNMEDGFVRYDPENLPYEKLHLCKYLSELPELTPEDVEDSQT